MHPAIIKRKIDNISDNLVEITEEWDLNHPECPYVQLAFKAYKDKSVVSYYESKDLRN